MSAPNVPSFIVTEQLPEGREFVYEDTYEMPAVAGGWLKPQERACCGLAQAAFSEASR